MALVKGTPVTLFGLTSRADLNHTTGIVQNNWDGLRYAIRLSDGTMVRVGIGNLAPIEVDSFVVMQRRLSYELHVYATHYSNTSDVRLFPVEKSRIQPLGKAFRDVTTKVELCEKKAGDKGITLRLYCDDSVLPYAQLRPIEQIHEEGIYEITVSKFDVVTTLGENSALCAAPYFRIVCGDSSFVFENEYPLFHLSLQHMDELTLPQIAPSISLNTIDIVRYNRNNISSLYYCAEERLLVFQTDCLCRIVSFQWVADAIVLARRVHATNYKMRLIAHFERSALLDKSIPPLPSSKRIIPNGSYALLDGEKRIVERRLHNMRLFLDNRRTVDADDLEYDAGSFLVTQVILISHMYEFLERKAQLQSKKDQSLTHYFEMLSSILTVIRSCHIPHISKELCVRMLNENEPSPGDFLLPYAFMDAVFTNKHQYNAWFSNIESLAYLLTNVCGKAATHVELTMDMNDSLCMARVENESIRVADFGVDPYIMQEIILKLQLTDTQKDNDDLSEESLMSMILNNTIQINSEEATKMIHSLKKNCNTMDHKVQKVEGEAVDSKTTAETDKASKDYDKTLTQKEYERLEEERRRLGDDLIREEETLKEKSQKTKKKKKKKCSVHREESMQTTSVVPDDLPEDEDTTKVGIESRCEIEQDATSYCSSTSTEYTLVVKSKTKSIQKKLETERDALTERVSQLKKNQRRFEAQCAQLVSENANHCATIEHMKRTNDAMIECRDTLEAEKSTLLNELFDLKKEVEAHRAKDCQDAKKMKEEYERKLRAARCDASRAQEFEKAAQIEMDAIRTEKDALEGKLSLLNMENTREVSRRKDRLMEKLRTQLLFYLKGHHMKLTPNTLSINALLRDGFIVKNTIDFYMIIDPSITQRDVLFKLSHYFDDISISGDGLSFCEGGAAEK
jgi:hypothetical protein